MWVPHTLKGNENGVSRVGQAPSPVRPGGPRRGRRGYTVGLFSEQGGAGGRTFLSAALAMARISWLGPVPLAGRGGMRGMRAPGDE